MIHQADALRIGSRPHPALRALVDILDALLPAIGYAPQKLLIGVIDRGLQQLLGDGTQGSVDAHVAGQRRGAEAVDLDAQLLQGALKRGEIGKYPDRAGDGRGTRKYLIRGARDVIPSPSGISAPGDDPGLPPFPKPLPLA